MDLIFALNNINTAERQFLAAVGNSKVFAFNGQMGAGKTTFIHAVCETLGVEEAICSPTFSIINHYRAANGETIYHIDLYTGALACNEGKGTCWRMPQSCPASLPKAYRFCGSVTCGSTCEAVLQARRYFAVPLCR